MSDSIIFTTEDVTARLAGLTEILAVLSQQYPKEDEEQLCAMLRGSIETLDQLAVLWPGSSDADLAMAARELQAGEKAPDLLRMALERIGGTSVAVAKARVPFAR